MERVDGRGGNQTKIEPTEQVGRPAYAFGHGESIPELIKKVKNEVSALFEKEAQLLQQGVSEKVARTRDNVMQFGTGALVALAGGVLLLFAAAEGINLLAVELGYENLGEWFGPLVVGAIAAFTGVGMVKAASASLSEEPLAPAESKQVFKEDKAWIRSKTSH